MDNYVRDESGKAVAFRSMPRHNPADYSADAAGALRFRGMARKKRAYDIDHSKFSPNALVEGFRRGAYILPRKVRRYLQRPLSAYQNRPRFLMAAQTLAEVIGRHHTGERNFVGRGCGIGPQGAGFFLSRQGLARSFAHLSEGLVREVVAFFLTIGFIERISPPGDLTEVRRPKNGKSPLGYFRRGLKATKDALGRIRSPLTMYRLGRDARALFAKTLRPHQVQDAALVEEPLWINHSQSDSPTAVQSVAGNHSGCADYDRAGHEPNDPRFSLRRPDPHRDPNEHQRFTKGERVAAEVFLEELRRKPLTLSLGNLTRPRGWTR